jgi:hypothetical protein
MRQGGLQVYRLFVVVVVLVSVQTSIVSADEDGATPESDTEEPIEDFSEYIVITFCSLFAACLSFIGVFLGYFSSAEDALMQRYKNEGVNIPSIIVSTEFARAGTVQPAAVSCNACQPMSTSEDTSAETEFIVLIQYKRCSSGSDQKLLIRKHVKATGSQFAKPLVPPTILFGELAGSPVDTSMLTDDESNTSPCQMDVLVLPGYPKSGLPLLQVERACLWRYRFPTVAIILSFCIFAGLCLYMAIDSLAFLDDTAWSDKKLHVTIILTVAIVVSEFVTIHECLGSIINHALEEQYLEGGESAILQGDDTTISSGDDSYLLM